MGSLSNKELCLCCGCGDSSECCCDFISYINTNYYNTQQHYLKYEVVQSDCDSIGSPTGILIPQVLIPDYPDFCNHYWQGTITFDGDCQNPPSGAIASIGLYCRSGELDNDYIGYDAAYKRKLYCDSGYRFRLGIGYGNSACDSIPETSPDDIGYNNNYESGLNTFLYLPYPGSGDPVCSGIDGFDTNCPPNLGIFEVYFRVEAPHSNGLIAQCDCCNTGDFYIIKISLDQDNAPTPNNGICP